MKEKLKINVCSLAFESREIRKQVDRIKRTSPLKGADPRAQDMIFHRRWHLRNESRAAQLLYGFVRGRQYRQIEPNCDHMNYKWTDARKRLRSKAAKFDIEWEKLHQWLAYDPEVAEVG